MKRAYQRRNAVTLTDFQNIAPSGDAQYDDCMRSQADDYAEPPPQKEKSRRRLGAVADYSGRKPLAGNQDPDNFFGTSNVQALSSCNFDEFVGFIEKAFVMFYNPCSPESVCPAREHAKAADRPHPINHAYAGVDCSANNELCCREGATSLPMFKVYCNGLETERYDSNMNPV